MDATFVVVQQRSDVEQFRVAARIAMGRSGDGQEFIGPFEQIDDAQIGEFACHQTRDVRKRFVKVERPMEYLAGSNE